MKSPQSCSIVSNYWRISRIFFTVILLCLGTDAAAESIRMPHVFHPCLEKILESLKARPVKILFPLPNPEPFPIGCLIPGCDLAVTESPLELSVEISGDLRPSALLEIDGLSQDQLRMLQLSGEIQAIPNQQTTFKVGQGRSRVSGLRIDLGTRMQTEELVTSLMERTAAPIVPTTKVRLSVDAEEAEKWVAENGKVNGQKGGPKIVIDLKLIQGNTTINESTTEYACIPCEDIKAPRSNLLASGDPPPLLDWIHVTEQVGAAIVDFGQDAVALVNGLIKNGSSQQWQVPQAYKSKAVFNMPYNMLPDDGSCPDPLNCPPEVSVFALDHGMTFLSPVPNWSPNMGDQVPLTISTSMITVPVDFYYLWENANAANPNNTHLPPGASCADPPTTACLANAWLNWANATLYSKMLSGITFAKRNEVEAFTANEDLLIAGCGTSDLLNVYQHFAITPEQQAAPTALRVYFVRDSTDLQQQGLTTLRLPGLGWTCATTPASSNNIDPTYYNEIFISTASANITTLAHEFGHAMSLEEANQIDNNMPNDAQTWACSGLVCLNPDNLMWSGSDQRTSITIGQSFRFNVNEFSAVYRYNLAGKVLVIPRRCFDDDSNYTCPHLALDP